MKPQLYILLLFLGLQGFAQHTVHGVFSPAEDFNWLIAYKVTTDGMNYITDGSIKDGKCALVLPEGSPLGAYRLVYAVPQEEFYFDIIYNGRENISFTFNEVDGVRFQNSRENILFVAYFEAIYDIEQQLLAFYISGNTDKIRFLEIVNQLAQTQQKFEAASEGLITNLFIRSNAPYIPANYEPLDVFIEHRKTYYFRALELDKPELQASGYLTDRLINFVLTAIPIQPPNDASLQLEMIKNVNTLAKQLEGVSNDYKMHLYHRLWKELVEGGYNKTSDQLYREHIAPLASAMGKFEIVEEIETHNRLRIGALAPEITWNENGETFKLGNLPAADNYVLIFWSSTCSHCLHELPKLHAALTEEHQTSVLAVGLEEDNTSWKEEISKLPHFRHAISLGKWESEYADLYNIQQTPTYYVLDKDKSIIARPNSYEDVLEFLNKNNGS